MTLRQDLTPLVRDWLQEPDGLPPPRIAEMGPLVHRTPQERGFAPRFDRWRFQSMFSATKLLVAGAIVALFGGFLLTGVPSGPSEDGVSPAGASASATVQVEPTAATTIEPEPTTTTESDTSTTTPHLLLGAELVTEEVEPGVFQVLSDGVRDLAGKVHDVTVTPEGDVWIEMGVPKDWSLVELGVPGVSQKLGRHSPWTLSASADGPPVAQNSSATRVFDGEAWRPTDLSDHDSCVLGANAWYPTGAVGPDGDCYSVGYTRDDERMLARIDEYDTLTQYSRAALGLEPGRSVDFPRSGPDGTIWAPVVRDPGVIFEGLVAYDGSAWSVVPYDGDDDAWSVDAAVGVDQDGVVWVSGVAGDAAPLLSWDGTSWRSHLADQRVDASLTPIRSWPNGVVWFGSIARWDGSSVSFAEPGIPWGTATPPAFAPDGSAWTVIGERLYVITPEAEAADQ